MSAAQKALEALDAAGKAATPGPLAVDMESLSVFAIDEGKELVTAIYCELTDENEGLANAKLTVLAVNLAAPLAAVARAAMERRKAEQYVKAERNSASKQGLWQAESLEFEAREKLDAALDVLIAVVQELE